MALGEEGPVHFRPIDRFYQSVRFLPLYNVGVSFVSFDAFVIDKIDQSGRVRPGEQ
jgi:hypothetical protein